MNEGERWFLLASLGRCRHKYLINGQKRFGWISLTIACAVTLGMLSIPEPVLRWSYLVAAGIAQIEPLWQPAVAILTIWIALFLALAAGAALLRVMPGGIADRECAVMPAMDRQVIDARPMSVLFFVFLVASIPWLPYAIGLSNYRLTVIFIAEAALTVVLVARWRPVRYVTRSRASRSTLRSPSSVGATIGVAAVLLTYLYPTQDMAEPWNLAVVADIAMLMRLVLFSPIILEFTFRGGLQQWLERRGGTWSALLGASVCYAVYHENVRSWPLFFAFALLAGMGYIATRSLWTPVLGHALANAGVVLESNVMNVLGKEQRVGFLVACAAGFLMASAVIVYFFCGALRHRAEEISEE